MYIMYVLRVCDERCDECLRRVFAKSVSSCDIRVVLGLVRLVLREVQVGR